MDFQITKNLDEQIVKDMTKSVSPYIRKLAYKGLIYQDYGEFVEKYGMEHDFKEAYELIRFFVQHSPRKTYKSTNPIFWDYVATNKEPLVSLYIYKGITPKILDVMIQQGFKVTEGDLRNMVIYNNLSFAKWALDHGYNFAKQDIDSAVSDGLLPMVMLLIKYGYEPDSENLHAAFCGKMFNMAQIFLDLGVEPIVDTIGCLLRDGEIEWAKFIINKFDLVPSKDTVGNLLLKSSNPFHRCEILKMIMEYIHLYPEFGPEGSHDHLVISSVIDAECPELFEQILELGYVPSEEKGWYGTGISDVFLSGNVDMASSLVKRGYRPSNKTLMDIRDLAFNKQHFYPEIDHREFINPSEARESRGRYRAIYDMLI